MWQLTSTLPRLRSSPSSCFWSSWSPLLSVNQDIGFPFSSILISLQLYLLSPIFSHLWKPCLEEMVRLRELILSLSQEQVEVLESVPELEEWPELSDSSDWLELSSFTKVLTKLWSTKKDKSWNKKRVSFKNLKQWKLPVEQAQVPRTFLKAKLI